MRAAHYPGKFRTTPAGPAPRRGDPRALRGSRCVLAAALAVAGLMLAGCGAHREGLRPTDSGAAWPHTPPADPERANAVLMRAFSLVGTPYRWGGSTPEEGFDCSGLVNYVYRDMLGLTLPRTSGALAAWQGPKVKPDRLAAADLVFFSQQGQVFHVGIYVGDGRFVHAPSSGKAVRIDRLDGPFWGERYSGARRVL